MEFLADYGLFLAKTVTIVLAIGAVLVMILMATIKPKQRKGELVFDDLSADHEDLVTALQQDLLDKTEFKAWQKQRSAIEAPSKRLFVIDFDGSMDAHEVEQLREEVTAVLAVATKDDEVLLRLESGGGVVHGYGLAASQLHRIKKQGVPLVVAVDKVAASGGYMMACLADRILAAPFAIVGSIGVVAQLPNFHKLLKKNDIDVEQFTAGEFKRTVTLFAENTDKGREKFQQELEHTHDLFKSFVHEHRPTLDISEVATGEHWFGYQALPLKLVDELLTSDDYLQRSLTTHRVYRVKYQQKRSLAEKAGLAAAVAVKSLYLQAARFSPWH